MINQRYTKLLEELQDSGRGEMRVHGNSMTPIIMTGSTLTFEKQETYKVGDVVFCKVKGRYIDAHKILQVGDDKRYLIGNNHGKINGWAREVYGKVVKIEK